MTIPKSYRVTVYVSVAVLAVALLILAVVSPEHFQRATAAVSPILAVVGSVLALLHMNPSTPEQEGDAPTEYVPRHADNGIPDDDGDHLQVIPAGQATSDTKADAAGLER